MNFLNFVYCVIVNVFNVSFYCFCKLSVIVIILNVNVIGVGLNKEVLRIVVKFVEVVQQIFEKVKWDRVEVERELKWKDKEWMKESWRKLKEEQEKV